MPNFLFLSNWNFLAKSSRPYTKSWVITSFLLCSNQIFHLNRHCLFCQPSACCFPKDLQAALQYCPKVNAAAATLISYLCCFSACCNIHLDNPPCLLLSLNPVYKVWLALYLKSVLINPRHVVIPNLVGIPNLVLMISVLGSQWSGGGEQQLRFSS